ncbi:hypothetical protein Wcon_00673 [Wolbachia endosymbiont of Cylisticus convexus]|nr:hypothetical protein Wcon_00951 [Wolbachia endosymbiont of Cylisticus convexus]RDD35026.1 hypothetical protein Wcon_00874 [Wolbachia endosymbiont of Cylisticus convexus]RDD35169.1 hypothetical protein Wcon_00673 [Wolbachia endosymbiont of Cylisticus convexus]
MVLMNGRKKLSMEHGLILKSFSIGYLGLA